LGLINLEESSFALGDKKGARIKRNTSEINTALQKAGCKKRYPSAPGGGNT
jgi:hypothetical protein